jgi:hypothetical protein
LRAGFFHQTSREHAARSRSCGRKRGVMPGLDPRLSGSIFMDRVHDVDSSVF